MSVSQALSSPPTPGGLFLRLLCLLLLYMDDHFYSAVAGTPFGGVVIG
tara:strand:+ start:496 stop:639 length:144 start_codon:yes stop_codon:yes gene_type:complete